MPDATPPQLALPPRSSRTLLAALILFCLAILPFLPAIHGEYVWDDDDWLVNNVAVHAWNGLHLIWNPRLFNLDYYPLTFSLLWLEHKLWGLNPIGYHLSNMLFHAGAALLLWRLLLLLRIRSAWIAALLWAIHPVQVESVAWVAEIKNVLSGFCYFLAALCYLKFALPGTVATAATTDIPTTTSTQKKWIFYTLSLLFFTLSLLSKSVTVTLPAGLFIILWCNASDAPTKFLRRALLLLPMLFVGLAIAAIRTRQEYLAMQIGGGADLHFTILQRIIIAGKDVWFFLRTLLFPFPLIAVYPRWNVDQSLLLNYLPALAVLLLALTLFLLQKKISRWPLATFLFFLVTLSPALGFINFTTMRFTFVADHYQYLASTAALVFLVELFAGRFTFSAPMPALLVTVLFLALASLTSFYATRYQTNFQLWSWTVDHNPDAFVAQHNLGAAYIRAGNLDQGLAHINLALHQAPDDDSILRTVAGLDLAAGRYDDALSHLRKAIAIRPAFAPTYILLGQTYKRMGRLDDALTAYAQAVHASPNDPNALLALADLLKQTHHLTESAHAYESAINLEPGNMIARYNYANLLLDLNRNDDAITQYQFILKYQPTNPALWDNLAYAYHQLGQDDKALAAKKRVNELEHPAQ